MTHGVRKMGNRRKHSGRTLAKIATHRDDYPILDPVSHRWNPSASLDIRPRILLNADYMRREREASEPDPMGRF